MCRCRPGVEPACMQLAESSPRNRRCEKSPCRRRTARRRLRRTRRSCLGLTPPSTSSSASTVARDRAARGALSSATSSNSWPPKPGITLITSTRSQYGKLGFDRRQRRRRIERQAGQRTQRANLVQHRPRVRHRFDVDRHPIGPGVAKRLDVLAPARRSSGARRAASRSPGGRPRRSECRCSNWARNGRPSRPGAAPATPASSTRSISRCKLREVARQQRRQHGRARGAKPSLQFITTKTASHKGASEKVRGATRDQRPNLIRPIDRELELTKYPVAGRASRS